MNMSNQEPRILIVNGQSVYDKNATGITLQSICSDFQTNSLLEVYYSMGDLLDQCDNKIKSFRLSPKTVPLNYFIRKMLGRNRIENYNSSIKTIDVRSREAKKSTKVKVKSFILGLISNSPVIIKDKAILEEIDRFSPEVIYTLGADIIPLKLARYFSKRYKDIPILLHYMDNWPQTRYAEFSIQKVFYRKLHKLLLEIQNSNKVALVISEKMACEYDKRFSPVHHLVLMNSVQMNDSYGSSINNKYECKQNCVFFSYLGGLHLNRDKQLLEIQKGIADFNCTDTKTAVKLRIYTSKKDRDRFETEFDSEITEFCEYVEHEKIFQEYKKADVLIHIESFDQDLIEFTKYSVSTKISEYMFSGKPILLYAPKEIAVYQYIEDCECGVSVCDEFSMHKAIERLVSDSIYREQLGERGVKNALKKHTVEAAHQTLLIACGKLLSQSEVGRKINAE